MSQGSQVKNVLLRLSVDIGDGRKDDIVVYEGDQPEILAKKFCFKHELDFTVVENLTNLIQQNLRQHKMDNESEQSIEKPQRSTLNRRGQMNADEYLNYCKNQIEKDMFSPAQSKPQICEKSRQMAKKRNDQNIPVYERLHMQRKSNSESQEKNMESMLSATSKSIMSVYTNKNKNADQVIPVMNIGIRLYYKGVKLMEESSRKNENYKQSRQKVESTNLTFTPKVDKRVKGSFARNKIPVEDYLIKKGQQISENKAKTERNLAKNEMKTCTFKPSICQKSEKMVHRRIQSEVQNSNVFSKLHQDQVKKKERLKELYNQVSTSECSFHPDIGGKQKTFNETYQEFLVRLANSKQQTIEKIQTLKEEKEKKELLDPVTGQEFFKPQILNNQNNHEPDQDFFQNLYERGLSFKQQKSDKVKQKVEDMTRVDLNYAKGKSEFLANQYNKKQIQELFKKLDEDQDGRITQSDISPDKIQQFKLLQPLLNEVNEENKEISEEEFCERAMEIIKPTIIKDSKNQEPFDTQTFIARLYEHQEKVQAAVQEKKQQIEQKEIEQCTFSPFIRKPPAWLEKRKQELKENVIPEEVVQETQESKEEIEEVGRERFYTVYSQ